MAKKIPQNKIGESFEQDFPNELVPDFIWDNISNALDRPTEPLESTEKIKASFEAGHEDLLPENLWGNLENQLEVEGVWKRVLKGLNRRTKRQYWQEKGVQFGIAALVLLLLRGCDFGEWSSLSPIANQSNPIAKVDVETAQSVPIPVASSKGIAAHSIRLNAPTITGATLGSNASKNNVVESNYSFPTAPVCSALLKTASTGNSETKSPIVVQKTKTSILAGAKSKQAPSNYKEKSRRTALENSIALDPTLITNSTNSTKNKAEIAEKASIQANVALGNKEAQTSNQVNNTPSARNPTTGIATTLATNNANEIKNKKKNEIKKNKPRIAQNTFASKNTTASNDLIEARSTKTSWSETPISTLRGQGFIDPALDKFPTFELDPVANQKKHDLRFELGMTGKVGTSLLLGTATSKAMETTSMIKTKTRATGGFGLMLDCYLTANDAIVFGAYPLSSSQQYFGGYTSEGRYYHKEVKLAYFDVTLGYQRTLWHYNDFGTIPSSMYVRLDYGLGYLSKSEEIINGLATELGNAYSQLHHTVGVTIGNTHRMNRFVIDYGIYGNIGLSSVQSLDPSGTSVVEYSNLATMGGYLGLRYVL